MKIQTLPSSRIQSNFLNALTLFVFQDGVDKTTFRAPGPARASPRQRIQCANSSNKTIPREGGIWKGEGGLFLASRQRLRELLQVADHDMSTCPGRGVHRLPMNFLPSATYIWPPPSTSTSLKAAVGSPRLLGSRSRSCGSAARNSWARAGARGTGSPSHVHLKLLQADSLITAGVHLMA